MATTRWSRTSARRVSALKAGPSTGNVDPFTSGGAYRPGGNADVPNELLEMIHSVAESAAEKSSIPFEPAAVAALEESLEPMLEALCAAAHKHAEAAGREEITEADLKAVSKDFMKNKS